MFRDTGSFNWGLKKVLIKRFELYSLKKHTHRDLTEFDHSVTQAMNIMFSQLTNINDVQASLIKSNFIRLYLIKSTRGRSHALGKPSRGQRT